MDWYEPSLAPFVPSPLEVVRAMLSIAKLEKGETLFDLGSGDGRIVIMAAQDFDAKAVGVELNETRARETRERVSALRLNDQVQIIQGNALEVDISPADVVTLYLTTSANEKLRPKMEKELRSGTRIVSHDFRIPGWEAVTTEQVLDYAEVHMIHLYVR